MMSTGAKNVHDLVLSRSLRASRKRIFGTWTRAEQLAQWWAPHGFTLPVCEVDARPGGSLYLEMCGPAGSGFEGPFPLWGTFVDVAEPERLVFISRLKDAAGAVMLELLNSITLVEQSGTTTQTVSVHVVIAEEAAAEPLAGMAEGWQQSLERQQMLLERLAGDT